MRLLVVFIGFLSLGGCVSNPFPDRLSTIAGRGEDAVTVAELDLQILARHGDYPNNLSREEFRNDLIMVGIRRIDENYGHYQKRMVSADAGRNIGLATTTTALGAWGALVSGGDTSQILSGITGLLTATDTSIDKETYINQTLSALFEVMAAERARVHAKIRYRMREGISQYSVADALNDLERYYRAGSLVGAIERVSEDAATDKTKSEGVLSLLRRDDFPTIEKQAQVEQFFGLVDDLDGADARRILQDPLIANNVVASPLIRASLGLAPAAGDAAVSARITPLTDAQARELLKRVIVLVDRDEETLAYWESALRAAQ